MKNSVNNWAASQLYTIYNIKRDRIVVLITCLAKIIANIYTYTYCHIILKLLTKLVPCFQFSDFREKFKEFI